ncbi:Acyl-CoA dehydrogenase; probable dibenzothiophene desulfurization enzyme [plant metagenome]|uniref:Acyl-CoA dehydrogenase probable dibenzothiophene desulfurization enzyme n=1 Tax=plant metagenome TaxID=1297885 RepID=A0A484THM3_9ZZZZ
MPSTPSHAPFSSSFLPPGLRPDLGEHAAKVEALAVALASTAAQRDREGGSPQAERQRLRDSGLLTLAVPREHGGAGERWPVLLRIVRRLAQADSSLAHLLAFQHLQVASVILFGSAAQQDTYLRATVSQGWFWGNAVNARDTRLEVTRTADGYRLDGIKGFCSGALGSDVLNVSVALGPAPTDRLFLVVPTSRAGIVVNDDWDNMGQRQTDSGTVVFNGVQVGLDEALGPPGAASSARATLRNVIGQLVLTELYLGNALGALDEAVGRVRTQVQPWAASGVAHASDDGLLQLRAGDLWLQLAGATALADQALDAFQAAWDSGAAFDFDARGELGMLVAAARVQAGRTALRVTEQIFDLVGARATTRQLGLDRYWRNVRVHTLHDPLDHRQQAIGRWLLTGLPADPYGYG